MIILLRIPRTSSLPLHMHMHLNRHNSLNLQVTRTKERAETVIANKVIATGRYCVLRRSFIEIIEDQMGIPHRLTWCKQKEPASARSKMSGGKYSIEL